jgi:hypothetical protein
VTSVILDQSCSSSFLIVCVFGFLIFFLSEAAISVLNESVAITFFTASFIVEYSAVIVADCSALYIVFCGSTLFVIPSHCVAESFSYFGTICVYFGVVFISFVEDEDRFLAETLVSGSTPDCALFEVVLYVVYVYPWWSDVMWCFFNLFWVYL